MLSFTTKRYDSISYFIFFARHCTEFLTEMLRQSDVNHTLIYLSKFCFLKFISNWMSSYKSTVFILIRQNLSRSFFQSLIQYRYQLLSFIANRCILFLSFFWIVLNYSQMLTIVATYSMCVHFIFVFPHSSRLCGVLHDQIFNMRGDKF